MITIKKTEMAGWKLLRLSDFARMQKAGTLTTELPQLFKDHKLLVNFHEEITDTNSMVFNNSGKVCRIQLKFSETGYANGDRYIVDIFVVRTKDVPSLGIEQSFMQSTRYITE